MALHESLYCVWVTLSMMTYFKVLTHNSHPSKFQATKICIFLCLLLQEVFENLRGPGLVLIDPPYEPYNEYLTWNLYTMHTFLGFELEEKTKGGKDWFLSLAGSQMSRGSKRCGQRLLSPCGILVQILSRDVASDSAYRMLGEMTSQTNSKLWSSISCHFSKLQEVSLTCLFGIHNTRSSILGFAAVRVYPVEFIFVVVMRNRLKCSFRIWSWSWIVVF